jgi:hypothetical protein
MKGMAKEINHIHKHNINILHMETHLGKQQEMTFIWLFLCTGMITNRDYKLPNEYFYILAPSVHFENCILTLRQSLLPMDRLTRSSLFVWYRNRFLIMNH